MDTSLGALRARLFNFRAWDSTGPTLDNRIREAMNAALDRISGDVPEAVIPDDEHVVLFPDVVGESASIAARMSTTSDTRVLEFTTDTGAPLNPANTWVPATDGTFDGIMHFEIVDSNGQRHRRQRATGGLHGGSVASRDVSRKVRSVAMEMAAAPMNSQAGLRSIPVRATSQAAVSGVSPPITPKAML